MPVSSLPRTQWNADDADLADCGGFSQTGVDPFDPRPIHTRYLNNTVNNAVMIMYPRLIGSSVRQAKLINWS
jgi:hypothetical protein